MVYIKQSLVNQNNNPFQLMPIYTQLKIPIIMPKVLPIYVALMFELRNKSQNSVNDDE